MYMTWIYFYTHTNTIILESLNMFCVCFTSSAQNRLHELFRLHKTSMLFRFEQASTRASVNCLVMLVVLSVSFRTAFLSETRVLGFM